MKRTIVLYNPKAPYYTLPLPLLAIASVVDRSKYNVVIVDGRVTRDPITVLRQCLSGAICFGVSVISGTPIKDSIAVSKFAKEEFPDVPVIWGGWHPSILPEQCITEGHADVSVIGQGELTFLEILARLEQGESLEGVRGCAYRHGGDIRLNEKQGFVDINNFPPYDYDLLPLETFFKLKGRRQIDFYSSQGCPYRCAFCSDPYVFNRRWSGLKGDRLLSDVFEIVKRYNVDDVLFQDENFFANQKRAVQFAEGVLRSGLTFTWAATSRADQVVKLGDELLRVIARSRCRKLIIGAESGSQEVLDRIKKDTLAEEAIVSAEKLHRHQIGALFNFIVGFPEEDFSSTLQTLETIKKIQSINPQFEFSIFFYTPYPGTELYNYLVEKDYHLPKTLEEWSNVDFIQFSGYWVSEKEREYVERFKFYRKLMARKNGRPMLNALSALASLRCRFDFYKFPIEKTVGNFVRHKLLKLSNW